MTDSNGESNGRYTPTQERLLSVLSDGLPHTMDELCECLSDPSRANLIVHVSILRKKIRPKGTDILCELWKRKAHYRHVRLLVQEEIGG